MNFDQLFRHKKRGIGYTRKAASKRHEKVHHNHGKAKWKRRNL